MSINKIKINNYLSIVYLIFVFVVIQIIFEFIYISSYNNHSYKSLDIWRIVLGALFELTLLLFGNQNKQIKIVTIIITFLYFTMVFLTV